MPRYQYLKVPGHKYPATLSYEVVSPSTDTNLTMIVGISFCHNKDRFSRDMGRSIADGRREKAPLYVCFANLDANTSFGKRIVESIHRWFDSNWKSLIQEP